MGFGLGSLVEKVCDEIGLDEDWGDAFGVATDVGLIVGCLPAGGAAAGILKSTLVTSAVSDGFENADDLVEELGEDPLTTAQWQDRIRESGYESYERAIARGEVDDDVLNDRAMQELRQEHEQAQAAYRNGLDLLTLRG